MASIDDELLMDEQENQRELAFLRRQLPSELKQRFSDDDLLWMLDAIVDYYYTSGILEQQGDEIDIDLELVAQHVCRQAEAEHRSPLDPQDVFFVVEADLDFQEENL